MEKVREKPCERIWGAEQEPSQGGPDVADHSGDRRPDRIRWSVCVESLCETTWCVMAHLQSWRRKDLEKGDEGEGVCNCTSDVLLLRCL